MSGIYLHIPFCKQACSYCDFYFVTRSNQKKEFFDALIREIHSKKGTRFTKQPIQTIYFGGGTPSLLKPSQIEQIMQALDEVFSLDVKECTLEMNPDDVKPQYLADLKNAGITRASMGVQSFDANLLEFMHRAHTREEALKSLEILASAGLDSFTVDLIYGNPGQSLEMLSHDLEQLMEFEPPHVSAYSLTIEPKTRLGKQFQLGRLLPPEDDEVAQHFDLVAETLKKHGIFRYEVSNFAKPGREALHNSAYWSHENYVGFGPAAHSFWWDEDKQSARRWNNKSDLNAYLSGEWTKPNELEMLNQNTLAEERIMLGLRTVNGVQLAELERNYGFTFSEKQWHYLHQKEREKKVIVTPERLKLTPEGLRIADAIVLDLLSC